MTDDDILRMAREAGGAWEYNRSHPVPCVMYDEELLKFAHLVAAAEREACAQSLDKQADLACDEIDRQWAQEMAAAVRARGEK